MSRLNRIRLLANDRGAAVIEMATDRARACARVIGIVDISNAYSRKLALEQGVQRAVEKIMQHHGKLSVESTLANEVSAR